MLRDDALPESFQYQDTGCAVHAACLTCPLVRCIYDDLKAHRRSLIEKRAAEAAGLLRDGMSIDGIAATLGASRRSVFRWTKGVVRP